MGKKKGRPKSELSKIHDIHIRLSYVDMAKLDFVRERTGKSRQQILREALDDVYEREYDEFLNTDF